MMTLGEAKEIIREISERKGKEIREPEQLRGEPEEAYKALGLVLANKYAAKPRNVAGWLAGNRHRFVPFLVGKDWWEARVYGLVEWAEAEAYTRGSEGLAHALDVCFLTREEMGEEFLRSIANDTTANILRSGDGLGSRYVSDVGSFRFRVDGEERAIPNGYGDGDFTIRVYPSEEREFGKKEGGILVTAKDGLEIADYDTGDFSPALSLPAGSYRVMPSNGNILIVKLS